jgi:hypothetical protein
MLAELSSVCKKERLTSKCSELFWGNEFYGSPITSSGCVVPCGGNSSELGGGGWRLNVYENLLWIDMEPVTFDQLLQSIQSCIEMITKMRELFNLWEDSLSTWNSRLLLPIYLLRAMN